MKKGDFYSQTEIVEVYDRRRFGGKGGLWVNKRELSIVKSLLPRSGKVLDVPSGTGRLARFLQGRGYKVVCADVSEPMLKKTKVATRKGTKIIKASAGTLPFKDSVFDAVVHLRFLFHFSEVNKFLRESKRVLKKGGVVVFDTYNWSPRAVPFLRNRVYIHRKKDVYKFLEKMGFERIKRKDCFIFSPLIYRFLPWTAISLLIGFESIWPKFLLVRSFWSAEK